MKKRSVIKSGFYILLIIAVFLSQFFLDISYYFSPEKIQSWLSDAGGFAPLFYIFVMAAAVVISPIPSLPLDISAGAFFGAIPGTIYSVTGALIGAVISFMISRILGRELVERFFGERINFCAECSDRILTRIVFLSRLLPVVSFDVISYGAGLTKMSLKNFTLATLFGMIPLTFLYNYFGSVLIFGKGLTITLGIIMVVFFFVLPGWLEKKGFKHKITGNAKTE